MMSTAAGLIGQSALPGTPPLEVSAAETASDGEFSAVMVAAAAAEPNDVAPDGAQSGAALALLAGLFNTGFQPAATADSGIAMDGSRDAPMPASTRAGGQLANAMLPAALLKAMGVGTQGDAVVAAKTEAEALTVQADGAAGVVPAAEGGASGERLIGALLEQVSAQLGATEGEQPSSTGPALYSNVREAVASAAGQVSNLPEAVRTAVGSPRWANELGSRLVMMSVRGQQEGSLSLTPEHLGPLEVRISVSQDTTNIWFGAQHADTRAALTDALPRLREMLAASGLALGHAGVSHEMPRQDARRADVPFASSGVDAGPVEAAPIAPLARSVRSALLDTWA
jgi:flagellar hook-length control protein FliK